MKKQQIRPVNSNNAYDVIVTGGGTAGVAAAIASAESGAKTLLVEAMGELGGTGTAGGVSHWLGGRFADCSGFVIGGLFRRFAEAAAAEGFALLPQPEMMREVFVRIDRALARRAEAAGKVVPIKGKARTAAA